jgi:hypothetical protein
MKNAKRYIVVKTATASSAIQAIPALHTVDTFTAAWKNFAPQLTYLLHV